MFLVRQKFIKFSKIYILYILFIDMHTKAFLLCLIKALERIYILKKGGEIGKHKLNEMGALNMKQNSETN